MRGIRTVAALLSAALLVSCAPGSSTNATPSPTSTLEPQVQSAVDGDTIETSAGTVRIIGIDAPERGECGYGEASALVTSILTEGDATILEPPEGENAEDQHGRLLRYVNTADGTDVARSLLAAGRGCSPR